MRIEKPAFQSALLFLGAILLCSPAFGQPERVQTLLIQAESASRELQFQKAAELLKKYLALTPHENHLEYRKDLRNWQRAARLKDRIDNSSKPALSELVELISLIDAYGEKKGVDALPYAEKALQQFPNSPEAILAFVKLRMTSIQHDEEKTRVKLLLDRAVLLDPANVESHSFRGHFYLWWLREPVEAEMEFHRALTLSENRDTQSWKDLGYIYKDRGKKKEAIDAFRTYLHLLRTKGAPVDPIVRNDLQKLEEELF